MKRKLFSAMLSIFALLLLMGAAAVPEQQNAALLAEEESVVWKRTALETEARPLNTRFIQAAITAAGSETMASAEDIMEAAGTEGDAAPTGPDSSAGPPESVEPVEEMDNSLLIDGQPAPLALGKWVQDGTTYVSLAAMAQQLDAAAQIGWDGSVMTVTTQQLSLTAKVGALYVVANERYLYVPETVLLTGDGQISLPLRTVARVFNAEVGYDIDSGVVTVNRGAGAIAHGDDVYFENDVFWLSRVIYRESGNQSLEGQMAVGNVVLNRIADPAFPDTVEGVLAQKNQFSTYKSGVLRKTEPSPTSVIAAKLVLDGGVVEETKGALFFDSGVNSWAARNKRLIATFGDHYFYG